MNVTEMLGLTLFMSCQPKEKLVDNSVRRTVQNKQRFFVDEVLF